VKALRLNGRKDLSALLALRSLGHDCDESADGREKAEDQQTKNDEDIAAHLGASRAKNIRQNV
jgi:hypothetical protein